MYMQNIIIIIIIITTATIIILIFLYVFFPKEYIQLMTQLVIQTTKQLLSQT